MIDARFRIELPADYWVAELSRAFPDATFRLLSGVRSDGVATELGEVRTDRLDDVVAAFEAHDAIVRFEPLERTDRRLLAKYETTHVGLYEFVERTALPPEFPIDVREGYYEFDLTGTREEFDRLRETLDAVGLEHELLSKTGDRREETLLTPRQRELLAAGLREGYFEVPRDCTLAELADAVGVDTSTASGVLRRGEARLVAWYLTGATDGRA